MALLELTDEEKKMIRSGRRLPESRPAQTGLSARELDIAGMNDRARQLRENEERRRDEWHRSNMKAHERMLEGALAAGSKGGRYSPITMDRMRNELEYIRGGGITGLRAHELDVLRQQGENAIGVEREKAEGLKNQGLSAAEKNLEASKYGWDKQLEIESEKQRSGLTLAERQIAGQERIAGMEHGTVVPDGKVIPGSRERVATIQAEAAAQQAELQRQHEIEKQTIIKDGNENVAAIKGAATAARREHQDAMREQKDFENWINTVNDFRNTTLTEQEKTALRQMTPEEQKAYWMKKTGRTPSGTQGAPAKRSWRDRYQPAQ